MMFTRQLDVLMQSTTNAKANVNHKPQNWPVDTPNMHTNIQAGCNTTAVIHAYIVSQNACIAAVNVILMYHAFLTKKTETERSMFITNRDGLSKSLERFFNKALDIIQEMQPAVKALENQNAKPHSYIAADMTVGDPGTYLGPWNSTYGNRRPNEPELLPYHSYHSHTYSYAPVHHHTFPPHHFYPHHFQPVPYSEWEPKPYVPRPTTHVNPETQVRPNTQAVPNMDAKQTITQLCNHLRNRINPVTGSNIYFNIDSVEFSQLCTLMSMLPIAYYNTAELDSFLRDPANTSQYTSIQNFTDAHTLMSNFARSLTRDGTMERKPFSRRNAL